MNKRKLYSYKIDKKIKLYGLCDFENRLITINPTRGGLINTIIHEELHRKHPDWSERAVIQKSKQIESRLSIKQSRDLLDDLIEKLKSTKYAKR